MKKSQINTNRKGSNFYLVLGIGWFVLGLLYFNESKWMSLFAIVLSILILTRDYFGLRSWRWKK